MRLGEGVTPCVRMNRRGECYEVSKKPNNPAHFTTGYSRPLNKEVRVLSLSASWIKPRSRNSLSKSRRPAISSTGNHSPRYLMTVRRSVSAGYSSMMGIALLYSASLRLFGRMGRMGASGISEIWIHASLRIVRVSPASQSKMAPSKRQVREWMWTFVQLGRLRISSYSINAVSFRISPGPKRSSVTFLSLFMKAVWSVWRSFEGLVSERLRCIW